jgi:hypothetical protein
MGENDISEEHMLPSSGQKREPSKELTETTAKLIFASFRLIFDIFIDPEVEAILLRNVGLSTKCVMLLPQ